MQALGEIADMAGSLQVVAVGQSDEERPPRSASPSRKQGIERETAHISAHVYPLEAQDQVWTWPHIGNANESTYILHRRQRYHGRQGSAGF